MVSTEENKPRNFLCRDATKPFEFSFLQYGKPASIVVCQTAEDETWPGGSLWDVGVILSTLFVELAGFQSIKKESSSKGVKIPIPARLLQAIPNIKDLTVLELGCGVGLTGIVAAAVLGTKLSILTDLNVVVERVTESNVELNSTPIPIIKGSNNHNHKHQVYRLTKAGKRGRVLAMPLSWGNEQDEAAVMECFRQYSSNNNKSTTTPKSQRKQKRSNELLPDKNVLGYHPDLIIIGDVAYQQKPGAPSHFDVLLSTVLKFLGPHTKIVFGTRMRYVSDGHTTLR